MNPYEFDKLQLTVFRYFSGPDPEIFFQIFLKS